MSVQAAVKPPPIVVGVQGIDASVVNTPDEPGAAIDWHHLSRLPPFQMFAEEVFEVQGGQVDIKAIEYILHQLTGQPGALDRLFQDYCQWHKEKGYWPKEDPMGRLIE